MSKSSVLISIDSKVKEQMLEKFKGKLGIIAEDAYRKELQLVKEAPQELDLLQDLIDTKRSVQMLALSEGGEKAVKEVAEKVKKELGHNPETLFEKINFWKEIKRRASEIILRARVEGVKKN